jgi:hypothetical protein
MDLENVNPILEYILRLIEAAPTKEEPKKTSKEKAIEKAQAEIDGALERLGKDETISVAKIVDLHDRNKIPTMIKHGVVAIFDTISGNTYERFLGAHNIAYWAFRHYGFIDRGGYGLTGRGVLRNKYHQAEGGEGGDKTRRYAALYRTVLGAA